MSKNIPSIDLKTYNHLIELIYEASMDMSLWSDFLRSFRHALNATSGLIRTQDLALQKVGIYIADNLDPAYQEIYKEYYIYRDPILPIATNMETGGIMQTVSHMPDSFKGTEFYNDYAQPQGMANTLGSTIVKDDSKVALIGLHRPEKYGHFNEDELELMRQLFPHLQRAFKINTNIMKLKSQAGSFSQTLNHLTTGVILLDQNGMPVFLNQEAEALVADKRYGLKVLRNKVFAERWDEAKQLQDLIAGVIRSETKTSAAVSISCLASGTLLNVLVCSISQKTDMDFGCDTSNVKAVLFVGDCGKRHDIPTDLLAEFFTFTDAESRLAAELANGQSLEQIATAFGISKHTARTQLKSCLRKAGVNRQSELVKLILTSPSLFSN